MDKRETKTIELPSGFNVEIITYWTWGERQEITKIILDKINIKLAGQTPSVDEIPAEVGFNSQKKTLELAVKRIVDKDGKEIPIKEIVNLPAEDVDFLLAEIEKISNPENKKKL